MTHLRIVSLVPSATETLLAWGIRPIAVTRFCEQPGLPLIGGTKDPDIAAIVALEPDLVVMCDQENRLPDVEALGAHAIAIHAIRITAVEHVGPQMAALAEAVQALGAAPCGVTTPPAAGPPVRAWIPIWKRPWMTINGDTYGSSLLAHLGVENVAGSHADRYPELNLEEAAALRPDLVLAPSEPYPFAERHVAQLQTVAPVVLVDGQDLFWWGARTAAASQRLAGVVANAPR